MATCVICHQPVRRGNSKLVENGFRHLVCPEIQKPVPKMLVLSKKINKLSVKDQHDEKK